MGSVQSQIEAGKQALQYFHNQALRYPQNYRLTYPLLLQYVNQKNPVFLEGLGFAIHSAELSEAKVKAAMERIAEQGQGRLPERITAFFSALQNEAVKIDSWAAFKEVAAGSAADLAHGAARFGNTVASTVNLSVKMVPLLLVGGVALYVFLKSKAPGV